MAVYKKEKVFSSENIINVHEALTLNYNRSGKILGDPAHVPKETLDKLIRHSVEIPENNLHEIENAIIIGDRLVVKDGKALAASFLNNRVIHEASVKRANADNVDIDDKFLRDGYPCETIDNALWLCGQHGSYQHWFTEVLPILSTYNMYACIESESKLIVAHDIKNYQLELLEKAGFQEHQIIRKVHGVNFRVKKLYVADNFSLNSFWVSPQIKRAYDNIFHELKDLNDFSGIQKKVVLARKSLGKVREVYNYNTLVDSVNKLGFEVVYPEDLSFLEKMHIFSQSSQIISLAGGGLCNIIFSKPSTRILAVAPDTFPINTFRDFGEIYNLNVSYALTKAFRRYDAGNLNANSFLDKDVLNKITQWCQYD